MSIVGEICMRQYLLEPSFSHSLPWMVMKVVSMVARQVIRQVAPVAPSFLYR